MKLASILKVVFLIQLAILVITGKKCGYYCGRPQEIGPDGGSYRCFGNAQCVSDCKKCDGELGIKCQTDGTESATFDCPIDFPKESGGEDDDKAEGNKDGGGLDSPAFIGMIIFLVILLTFAVVGCVFAVLRARKLERQQQQSLENSS